MKELRNFPQDNYVNHVEMAGFGYDSSIDDFKVVIGYRFRHFLRFDVLELKTNIWRSVGVSGSCSNLSCGYESYERWHRVGILGNGAIHWSDRSDWNNKLSVIVSFDLSKEVFKEIPLPKLDNQYDLLTLGTMKDRLCIFPRPHINNLSKNKEMEIWVTRNYNAQESWERKLPPPGYDANKITMDYIPHRKFLSGHVHIWLLDEGCALVLVRSIDRPYGEEDIRYEDISLSTYSESNYNYNDHVFVKSLVSPSGMGDGDEVRSTLSMMLFHYLLFTCNIIFGFHL